jgi:hypothetical protein
MGQSKTRKPLPPKIPARSSIVMTLAFSGFCLVVSESCSSEPAHLTFTPVLIKSTNTGALLDAGAQLNTPAQDAALRDAGAGRDAGDAATVDAAQ